MPFFIEFVIIFITEFLKRYKMQILTIDRAIEETANLGYHTILDSPYPRNRNEEPDGEMNQRRNNSGFLAHPILNITNGQIFQIVAIFTIQSCIDMFVPYLNGLAYLEKIPAKFECKENNGSQIEWKSCS